ncbi:hypothetical protein K492DRAFT_191666 [Lichtheimia hyalospora FSU 10163]|nr:hypothetical protein K492DRAFT_191666 [Lichtheimia hyalospora FSU 10163]
MKDIGIKHVEIVPAETVLDFMGRIQSSPDDTPTNSTTDIDNDMSDGVTLKGEALFALTRPLKIKSMVVKLKGMSSTSFQSNILELPILPKLKQALFGKMTLPAGEHVIPFLLEIPNIYPPSLKTKRASIAYKIELSMAVGLQKKYVTAEHPIQIRRHQLCSKSETYSLLMETRLYENTIPARFHYEIDAPQAVSLENATIPVSIRYLCFATQKSVRRIRTQLKQIEMYSSDCKSVNRKLQSMGDYVVFTNNRNHKRYVKRTIPAHFHSVESTMERSTWTRPLEIQHNMHRINVTPSLESPLISVCHELEITFQFEHQFEDIKAKIPIILASTPQQEKQQPSTASNKLEWEEEENEYDPQGYAEQQQQRQGVMIDRPLQMPHFRHILASSSSAVKHSLDEDRLGINNSRIVDGHRVVRKSPSANDLTHSHQNERHYGDHEHEYDPKVYHDHHPLQLSKCRRSKHDSRRKHSLQPINVDLANSNPAQTSRNKHRDYTSGQDHMTLRTRPPSMVYSNAPGLPAATELRPQEAAPTSLLEESFISDDDLLNRAGDRSPDLATIASSTLLSSPRTVVFNPITATDHKVSRVDDDKKEGGRRKSFGMPAPPPPPQTPLPPIPLSLVKQKGYHGNRHRNDTRKTKLYTEDSDEEKL